MKSDAGQISSWIVKLVVFLLLGGLVIVEGGGILFLRLTLPDAAREAAQQAGFTLNQGGSDEDAQIVARDFADTKGATFVSMTHTPLDKTVKVTLEKKSRSFVVHKIGPLKKFTTLEATGSHQYGN
ncbi:MAG TPA: hypothetical protein VND22_03755 [Actinomycetota bacterium]|nr:hypothetical protein [Actinomycetota bacterium]